jgi:large subunit ribosomal protein L5
MRKIRVGKVNVNISVGQSGEALTNAMTILEQLTGQRPATRSAKQTIRGFGIRKREPMACIVTLRGNRGTSFLNKALSAVSYRINPKAFDNNGNFAFGIREHIDMSGTRYDPNLGITGMDVIVNFERPGYRVSKRKRARSKVGHSHRIKPDEAIKFLSEQYNVRVEDIIE